MEWLGAGLRPDRPGRLPREYPLVFSRSSSAIPIVAWKNEGPVSHATLWPVSFRIGSHLLRVALVSHVYTDPNHLREGLASEVVSAAIELARQAPCGLVLLWSDLERLYHPLGFERAGEESLIVLDRPSLDRASASLETPYDLHVETARPEDWGEIEQLRGSRTCQLELPPGAIREMRDTPDLDVQVARGPHGVEAFAMRGRGDDLQEVIHEWGGRPEAAIACCRALLERCAPWHELFLMAPVANDPLAWALRQSGARRVRQPLGWMRVASTTALAEDLSALVATDVSIEIEPVGEERSFRVSSIHGECTLARRAFLEGLFGGGATSRRSDLRAPLGASIAHLPLPFHVAGLESI